MKNVTINDVFDAFFTTCKEKIARIETSIKFVPNDYADQFPAEVERIKKYRLSYMVGADTVFANQYSVQPRPMQYLTFLDAKKKSWLEIKIYYRYKDEEERATGEDYQRAYNRMLTYMS